MPPATKFHQTQLPAIPLLATRPVTTNGVSAAKVVATMDVPASHQGHVAAGQEELIDVLTRSGLVVEADGDIEEEVEAYDSPIDPR